MCLGIPGKVVGFTPDHPDLGRVDVQGEVRDVNLAFLEDDPAQPGDWVLIHLGFALQKMTGAEVADALALMSDLGDGPGDGAGTLADFTFDPERIYPTTVADEPGHGERPS